MMWSTLMSSASLLSHEANVICSSILGHTTTSLSMLGERTFKHFLLCLSHD